MPKIINDILRKLHELLIIYTNCHRSTYLELGFGYLHLFEERFHISAFKILHI